MTVRPIRYLGDPVLRRPAAAVEDVNDAIRALIDDMIESMHEAQGVGLAAPQIGVGLQVVVLGMPDEEPFALVNPRVKARSGTRLMEAEGCLSVPGYRGALERSVKVTVEALDAHGRRVEITAEDDLLAEALEHEVDHLNGILYVDHVPDLGKLQKLRGTGWVDEGEPGDEVEEIGATTAGGAR
ncbi:MAG: peptide deformylase [Dehalococcoidia bacterium]|nr:peptide deformylase [Dehalococcoidia bacterium]